MPNTKLFKTSLLTLFFTGLALSSPAAPLEPSDLALKCKKGKAPLFSGKKAWEPTAVEIVVDYKNLNKHGIGDKKFMAVMKFLDAEGASQLIPVALQQRGNSRRNSCTAKPLRIIFLEESIAAKISAELPEEPNEPKQMSSYLKALEELNVTDEQMFQKQSSNIFQKLGDDAKIVTHCGKASWEAIGGDTVAEQTRRLNEEYLLYRILTTLRTTTLNSRYAEITYRDTNGKKIFTRPGFFREPPSETKDRCKIDELEEAGADSESAVQASRTQAEILLKFVVQNDYSLGGHNVALIKSAKNNTYLIPYDFDLSAISNPDYFKNQGFTLEQSADKFEQFLKDNVAKDGVQKTTVIRVSQKIYKNQDKMRKLIDASGLTDERKKHFHGWLDMNIEKVTALLTANDAIPVEEEPAEEEQPEGEEQ